MYNRGAFRQYYFPYDFEKALCPDTIKTNKYSIEVFT